jgi:hypothetical protein
VISIKRAIVAACAVLAGTAVVAALILYQSAEPAGEQFLVVGSDVPAGAPLAREAIRVERLRLGDAGKLAFARSSLGAVVGRRATHALQAGQLLQQPDLMAEGSARDRRLVWIPAHDLPPLAPGDRVDLLQVSGSGEQVSVVPFALGVEVRSATASGLVVAVSSRQAPGFVYAAAAGRLVVVAGPAGSAPGEEEPVANLEQAEASVR